MIKRLVEFLFYGIGKRQERRVRDEPVENDRRCATGGASSDVVERMGRLEETIIRDSEKTRRKYGRGKLADSVDEVADAVGNRNAIRNSRKLA